MTVKDLCDLLQRPNNEHTQIVFLLKGKRITIDSVTHAFSFPVEIILKEVKDE